MKCKLSIVIPAYNAEHTISKVIDSVANALSRVSGVTEIIVVDDGSTDRTGVILDEMSCSIDMQNVSLRVLHQSNSGCYRARLAGLRIANCEYFGFVDSDDFVEPEMYVEMLKVAESCKADVVECSWRLEGVSERDEQPCTIIEEMYSENIVKERYIIPTLIGCGTSAYLWNKIYKCQYDFSRWIDGDFGSYEDLIHNLQLFQNVQSFVRVSNKYYRYAPTDASVTRTFNPMHVVRLKNTVKAKYDLVRIYLEGPQINTAMRTWLLNEKKNYVKKAILASHGNLLALIRNLIQLLNVNI